MREDDQHYMRAALTLARRAYGLTSPNPMVGAVLVKAGRVIARGFHRRCGAEHAEAEAIRKAGALARGSALYVNLEPCFHVGHTPPCVDAVIEAGICEVVIGHADPNPKTNGKSILKMRRAGINVRVGVCRQEAERLNEGFITFMKEGRPFIAVKSAQTLDGKIAVAGGDSKWITTEKTRLFARRMRDQFDAIMIGSRTALRDDPRLDGCNPKKKLKKIVLDTHGRLSLKAQLFKNADPGNCIVVTTKRASVQKRALFSKAGVEVLVAPLKDGRIDIKWTVKALAQKKILSILIEGGACVIGSAYQAGLVDKVYCYIAPKIMGDAQALSAVDGRVVRRVDQAVKLRDWEITKIGEEVLIEAYVLRNH